MAPERACKRNEMYKRDAEFASIVLPDFDQSHLPAMASFEYSPTGGQARI